MIKCLITLPPIGLVPLFGISTANAQGVALVAIQRSNRGVKDKKIPTAFLEKDNSKIKARLNALEHQISKAKPGSNWIQVMLESYPLGAVAIVDRRRRAGRGEQ